MMGPAIGKLDRKGGGDDDDDCSSSSKCQPMHEESCHSFGQGLTPDIWIHVLSFVPNDDLLRNCTRVCKMWQELLDGQSVWKSKCIRNSLPYPRGLASVPQHFYRTICLKNPYGRNLIKNPCGKKNFDHWLFETDHRGWVIEDPPTGADPFPESEKTDGDTSCFSTTYYKCTKWQEINLIQEGCIEEHLDIFQPPIVIRDWFAARFDCASRYFLEVTLLSSTLQVLDNFTYGPVDEVQWAGSQWHKVEHCFQNYGSGVRFVRFLHFGHDLQFWAGNYGSKMTASTVRVLTIKPL